MKFIRTNFDLIFLWLMSLIGVALVLSATSRYGAGLPSDSAWYISAADNLLRGKGLLQFDSSQLTAFPPLFTLLIAVLSRLLNMDVFIIGWILNVLLFGINILLSGLLIRKVFSPGSVYFYLGVMFTALSPSFLRMHASILTEPLFVTLMLGSIFIARKYLIKPDIKLIWGLGALAASAALLRFVGISLIASGFLIILLGFRRNWKQTLSHAMVFGLVSGIPIVSWLYFYNYRLFGAFLYPGNPRNANIKENFLQALRKIYYWFVP